MTTLNVPADLGEWLKDHKDAPDTFKLANELAIACNSQSFHFKTRNFIESHTTEIWEVIAGKRKHSIA